MEKQDSKSKRKLVIFLTVSICIILLTSTLSVLFLLQLDYNTRCYKDLVKDNKEMPIETKQYKEKIITLDKEIGEYKNIDQAIINAKADYFKAIKEVEDQILAGTSNRKIAYLTFDDGPYFNTYKVLDILDRYNVKATFFTTNINGDWCYDNKKENCFKLYKDNKEIYSKNMKESLYLLGFMNALFLRENCYSCKYAQEERVSDVTIGDFWGLGDDVEFNYSKKEGVSLILSNTIKGDKLINLCKGELFLEERSIKEAIKGNAQLRRPSIKHKNYYKFQREYPSKGFVRATRNSLRTDIIKDKIRTILIKNKHIHKIGKKLKNINRVI